MTGLPPITHPARDEPGTTGGRDSRCWAMRIAPREEASSDASSERSAVQSAQAELVVLHHHRSQLESEENNDDQDEDEEELDSEDGQEESELGFEESEDSGSEESEDSGSEESEDSDSEESEDSDSEESEESESASETGESEMEEKYGPVTWKVCHRGFSWLEGPAVNGSSPVLLVRANKRLVELLLEGRHALECLPWSAIWRSVLELDKSLNRSHSAGRLKSLGLFLPILSRLFDDLDRSIHAPSINSKAYRQGLDRHEAKALTVMQQKWPKLRKQEMHVELRTLIQQHSVPKPQTIVGAHDRPTRIVLDSLERVLLHLTHRLSLCNLRLAKLPAALLDAETITSWYTSFGPIFGSSSSGPLPPEPLEGLSADAMGRIKYLDVSRNELTEIPQRLTSVFPRLWKLNLTRNPLDCLPMSLREWARGRVRVDRLKRRPTGRHRLGRIVAQGCAPPTLVESCLSRLIKAAVPTPDRGPLPPHLVAALARGRLCDHCRRFRWAAQKAIYLPGHGSRQKNLPLVFGPSFLCPACLHLLSIRPPASSH
ncbi:uncharacterized protein PGTG_21188 [Puccinia graminis f. sp. tritici CRL 75-36-700-3]|uniref:Uncharacterized protein n=1 Tax=Puccinia graminis f. sp. tritici (strain CRL 75-36-700-3 / race SCCL) TaxID=418459 RepID=H6QQI0_PUCGT|nr:uncharacterized protein PGTG_21188 [Puccinia graminis f. sp. tritici CRL 75-36-700-3]EHS62680.1 hypothetical protein PGTG_21188 [Puccinia graminis f. sp. tritici CRL 75-36-700-3]